MALPLKILLDGEVLNKALALFRTLEIFCVLDLRLFYSSIQKCHSEVISESFCDYVKKFIFFEKKSQKSEIFEQMNPYYL